MCFAFSDKFVDLEMAGQVMLIGINRPEKKNAVNRELAKQLVNAFQKLEDSEDALTAVLYGKGTYIYYLKYLVLVHNLLFCLFWIHSCITDNVVIFQARISK